LGSGWDDDQPWNLHRVMGPGIEIGPQNENRCRSDSETVQFSPSEALHPPMRPPWAMENHSEWNEPQACPSSASQLHSSHPRRSTVDRTLSHWRKLAAVRGYVAQKRAIKNAFRPQPAIADVSSDEFPRVNPREISATRRATNSTQQRFTR
jgi:hypothetical protein